MSKPLTGSHRGALYQPAARDALIAQAAALQAAGPAASDVGSPCVSICQMDGATGWCAGCLRTLEEIADWARLSEGSRRDVWQGLSARAHSLNRLAAHPHPPEAP